MRRPLKNITRDDLDPVWNDRKIPLQRIADALGVSRQGLSWKAKSLGLKPRGQNQEPNKLSDDALFARMWNAGVNVSEMARHFGYATKECVSVRRRALGLAARTRGGKKGSRSGWAETTKLSDFWEIDGVRRLHEIAAKNRAAAQKTITKERAEG